MAEQALVCVPAPLDLFGLSELRPLTGWPALSASPEMGLIDFHFPVKQPDGFVFDCQNQPPELEEEALGLVGETLCRLRDVVLGESEFENQWSSS